MSHRCLSHVTLSGADHTVNLDELEAFLGECRPGSVELGVLLSASRAGEERYPKPAEAVRLIGATIRQKQRSAVHLCGHLARIALAGAGMTSEWAEVVGMANRVQVNLPEPDLCHDDAARLVEDLGKPVVLQLRECARLEDTGSCRPTLDPHMGVPRPVPTVLGFPPLPEGATWLFDQSAGRGLAPAEWPVLPEDGRLVGYAGGIDLGNVGTVLTAIQRTARSHSRYWIDLETGLREPFAVPERVARETGMEAAGTFFSINRARIIMSLVDHLLDLGHTEQETRR
jgi:hypothetical protein